MGDLSDWLVVKAEIDRSKVKRFNWKALFGKSLTKVVANGKARGLSSGEVISEVVEAYPGLTDEAIRRLRIGVCARFGEINSESREIERVKNVIKKSG